MNFGRKEEKGVPQGDSSKNSISNYMNYLIFSDESGKWNDGEYYIRSWIRIASEKYDLLRKENIFSKHETGVKELKWEKFRKNYKKFKNLFDVDFDIFITISKPAHFQSKNYKIIEEIKKVPVSTGGEALTDKVKEKIVDSAKHQLFLNYFEKTHIEASKKALLSNEDPQEYEYFIDKPQWLSREWESIAKECGVQQIKIIEESSDSPGIELADVISGCIMDLLGKKDNAKAIYNECMKHKMVDMRSEEYPNPDLVFYKDFSEEDKGEANIFR